MGSLRQGRRASSGRARGFSLIELLVVIAIIAVVIAILVPALGHARVVARNAATVSLLSNLQSAINTFQQEHNGRAPGYFTPRQMGDPENENAGVSSMENIMLDLAGGIVDDSAGGTDTNIIDNFSPKGTGDTEAIRIDVNLIGVKSPSNPAYFTIDPKYFEAQQPPSQQVTVYDELPDLIDAHGNPIIAWVRDNTALDPVDDFDKFAARDSTDRARFYWVSNAAFLQSTGFGRKSLDQSEFSMIGSEADDDDISESLCGALGSPLYPVDPADPEFPRDARSGVVLHAAGADGLFFGKSDRGRKQLINPDVISYKDNWTQLGNGQWTGAGDVTEGFDDVLISVGN